MSNIVTKVGVLLTETEWLRTEVTRLREERDALREHSYIIGEELSTLWDVVEQVRDLCADDAGREGGLGNRYADGSRDMAIEVLSLLPKKVI